MGWKFGQGKEKRRNRFTSSIRGQIEAQSVWEAGSTRQGNWEGVEVYVFTSTRQRKQLISHQNEGTRP